MQSMAGRRIVVGLVVLLAWFASPAWAEEPALAVPKDPTARQHFVQGNRLYRIRKFDDAITEYQKGALIEVAPVFDYNLGQCYRQLGKYEDAIWHYERFLKNGRPGPDLHALVTGFLQQMRAELERKAMTQPPTEIAETSAPRPAQREPPRSATTSSVPAASAAVAVHDETRWHSDRTGWSLVAVGAVGGGIATYLLVRAASLRDEVGRTPNEVQRVELRDASRARDIAGAAVSIGSAALIAAGVIKLAVHRPAQSGSRSLSWGTGASVNGAFVFGQF